MQIDPNNPIVKLCAQGMELEGQGKTEEASDLFLKAWNESTSDFEKFTAAHYVARHQTSVSDKLKWDQVALHFAEQIDDISVKAAFPSLLLNIGKAHEDLGDFLHAKKYYEKALGLSHALPANGYGDMIKAGIQNGIKRLAK